jgi:hypothetical protein
VSKQVSLLSAGGQSLSSMGASGQRPLMADNSELESDNFSKTRDAIGSPDLVDNGNRDSGSACESDSEVKREHQFYYIFHVKAST